MERSVYKDQLNQEKFFWRMELQEKRKKIEASLEIAKGDCFKQHLEMILFNMFVCIASSDIVENKKLLVALLVSRWSSSHALMLGMEKTVKRLNMLKDP